MPPRTNLSWSSLAAISGLLSVNPVGVFAQYTNATCAASFSWMDNSKGQIPCLVAAFLQEVCNGGNFSVPALPQNYHYAGPTAANQNQCVCSSVTYNILSACGLCQNQSIISWTAWNGNCSDVYTGIFPLGIPDGTAVPQWAFQNVTTSDLFNVALAQAVGDSPESTATHAQSTHSAIATSTTLLASTTVLPSVTASPGTKSNADPGAIAGGVVGGLVGVALIATVIFIVMKKKRSRISSFVQFSGIRTSPPSAAYTASTSFAPQMTQPKLYDPADPTTFPPPPSLTPLTRTTGSTHDVSIGASYSVSSLRPGAYGGTPEV